MRIVILDAATLGENIDFSPIHNLGEVSLYPDTQDSEVRTRIQNADCVIINKVKLNASNLKDTGIKQICIAATGYDNIDISFCRKNGIAVCNVPGYSTDSVAQITVACVLQLVNHLNTYTNYVKNGSYTKSGIANILAPSYHELSSMTWGIVGYGNIGKKVETIAKAFGCNTVFTRRTETGLPNQVSLSELCRTSDIITLHTPLTAETKHLIGEPEISSMKPSVVLFNAARGAVTDEVAITEAILNHRIAGFGSDVYSQEPFLENHPFNRIKNLENVCLTPHMAWGACEARNRCIRVMADNILAFQKGERLNRVDLT